MKSESERNDEERLSNNGFRQCYETAAINSRPKIKRDLSGDRDNEFVEDQLVYKRQNISGSHLSPLEVSFRRTIKTYYRYILTF